MSAPARPTTRLEVIIDDGTSCMYQHIPMQVIHDYVKVASTPNRTIVSVGSGNGYTEAVLREKYKLKNEIICVDPKPESYRPYRQDYFTKPHYASVDELLAARPELVDNCTLLLIWADEHTSMYDGEALMKLFPLNIVAIYEKLGAAGGQVFHNFVKMSKEVNIYRDLKTYTVSQIGQSKYLSEMKVRSIVCLQLWARRKTTIDAKWKDLKSEWVGEPFEGDRDDLFEITQATAKYALGLMTCSCMQ